MSDEPKRPVKPDPKWATSLLGPFVYLEWCMEWIVYVLSKLAIFKILEYAAKLTILIALIAYLLSADDRKRQAELNAWQVINSAKDQRAASGRIEALEYLNKTGVNLNFLSVADASLVGTEKKGKNKGEPRGINLSNARLVKANFAGSKLKIANFSNALLEDANLEGADLWFANLAGADLSKANLAGADLWKANLEGTILTDANLTDANLSDTNLEGAILFKANLEGTKLFSARLRDTKLMLALLKRANLMDAILVGADLEGANLTGAKLVRAQLGGARNTTPEQLCKAETLYRAYLDPGILEEVKKKCKRVLAVYLVGYNLADTDYSGEDLKYANFSNTKFVLNTDFSDADLRYAKLVNTNFEGADFSGANLSDANLAGAEGITPAQLCQAKTLYEAKMDPDLRAEVQEQCPEKLKEHE